MPAIGSDQQHYQLNHTITTHRPILSTDHEEPLAVSSHLSASSSSSSSPSPTPNSIASIILSNFLPSDSIVATTDSQLRPHHHHHHPTVPPPSIENLVVANSAEDLSNFRDVTFDFFDEDDSLFGSPLAFDASENGLWNGRFVPPPPRPPFFVDEPVLSDGLTTCDLCSWAMPTKSTFIFEGTIEKASELGWPLTLIIVSILSALLGAIIMITVVRCKRKKSSNNRNETHVQWWSRNKRPNNNNHLRRSNIYTAHPADSIRGLQQPALSASSSLTAMTAMGVAATTSTAETLTATTGTSQQYYQQQQQQQNQHPFQQQQQEYAYEHEYHQPQELQLHIQQQQQQQQLNQHQRQPSSSISSDSTTSTPSLTTTISTTMMPIPMQLQHQQQHHDACNWSNGVTIIGAS